MNYQYFIVYKPYNVLTQFTDEAGRQTLKDYFAVPPDVYPVGRLDYDSEGLLLLTNDKALNHRLLNPAFAHQRTYLVQVDGAVTPAAIQQLQQGVSIRINGQLHRTKPCLARICTEEPDVPPRNPPIRFRKEIPAPWIALTLTEGKNRQVRRMTAAVGYPTLRLIRVQMGQIILGNMQPGELLRLSREVVYARLFNKL
jgi:23S rRNA pseudouridine2457 synthase